MNKLYISALAVTLMAGTVSAQSNRTATVPYLKEKAITAQARGVQPTLSADRAVIWSNDFSDPTQWSIGNINDPNNDNWVIGTTAPGGPPYNLAPIASTTAANGFALFDSNVLCGGTQNAWIATANPIDLSAYPGVVLQFQQYYREFQGRCYVESSTDGTTWTTTQINILGGNTATTNPQTLAVNFSSVGGSSTVWFRFRYEGGCDYSWMIDDVELVTLPDHELIMAYGYTAQFGNGYEYGRIPQAQMPSTLVLGAEVVNFGGLQQNNITVTATVTDGGGNTVATATSNITSMINGDTVVTEETVSLPTPLPVGLYTTYFTVTSDDIATDDNPNNNSSYRYFEVTQDLYSVDGLDVLPDSLLTLAVLGTASFTDNSQDVRFLNLYQIPVQQTFSGVEIYLSSTNTDPGSYFIAAVYDTVDVYANDLGNPLVESEIRVITQADIDNGTVSVAFLDDITLGPDAYFVGVRLYEQGGNNIAILDDKSVAQPYDATLLWLPVDDQNQNLYSNGTAAAIRLSSSATIGIQETSNLEGVTMYPSPTSGPVQIRMETPGNMTVEVFNVLGGLVKTASFNGTATTLDLTGNSAGIYTVRVSDGSRYNVQRITLK